MGLVIILPFAALACFGIIRIYRLVFQGDPGPEQRKTFVIHLAVGIALGIWLGFFMSYRVANKRMAGFPIPTAISSLDDGKWTTNVPPPMIHYPAMVTDFLFGVAAGLVPMAVAAFLKDVRDRREAEPRNDPNPPPP